MRDDGGGSFEELELWGIAHDDGISWKGSEVSWIESAAEGEDELNVEAGAGFGDCSEDSLGAVLKSAEGGVYEPAAVEAMPGEGDGWPLLVVDERSGVVKVRRLGGGGELQRLGQLRDLGQWGERVGGVGEGFQVPGFALVIDDRVDGSSEA